MIISEAAAKMLFPGEEPIGQQVRPAAGGGDAWFTVIGVVEDVLVDDLRRKTPEPMVYLPGASTSPAYVMKSARADQLAPEVRAVIRELVPQLADVSDLHDEDAGRESHGQSVVHDADGRHRAPCSRWSSARSACTACSSYGVTERRQEIGVRMALGAEAKSVRRMFVWQGTRVALVGVVVGALAAVALTRYVQTLFFGVGQPGRDGVRRHVCRDAGRGAHRELHAGAACLARRSSGGTAQRNFRKRT